MNFGLNQSTAIVCESCQNPTFIEVTYLRKVSRLLTGRPDDSLMPVPTFACSNCGSVNEEFKIKEAEPTEPSSIIQP